jgi:hypothetical protein
MTEFAMERLARLESWREEFAVSQARVNADTELRLRRLERAMYFCTGALGLLQLALKFWK